MTDDHPNAEDWRNRCERAEQECAELREEIARLREEVQSLTDELAYHGIYPNPLISDRHDPA